MRITLTESQLKNIVEEVSKDERMIKKARTIYKALKKGRGMVKVFHWSPLDVSYILPDIDSCLFQVRPSWDNPLENMVFITMMKPVEYKIHNLEQLGDNTPSSIIKRFGFEIGYVYCKRFDHFNIAIGENG